MDIHNMTNKYTMPTIILFVYLSNCSCTYPKWLFFLVKRILWYSKWLYGHLEGFYFLYISNQNDDNWIVDILNGIFFSTNNYIAGIQSVPPRHKKCNCGYLKLKAQYMEYLEMLFLLWVIYRFLLLHIQSIYIYDVETAFHRGVCHVITKWLWQLSL